MTSNLLATLCRTALLAAALAALGACSGEGGDRAAMYDEGLSRLEERLAYLEELPIVQGVSFIADGSRNHVVVAVASAADEVPALMREAERNAGLEVYLGEMWAVQAPHDGGFPPQSHICIVPRTVDDGHEMTMTHC